MNRETLAALGEPNRLRIIELLRAGPRPVNDIHVRLKLRQSQASQHLTVLRDVGLVEMEPRAQQRFYRLRPEPLKQLHEWLDRYRHIWEQRFEELDKVGEELKRRNSRMQQATTDKNAMKNETILERTSDRELTVTRTFNAPAHIVFEAWTKPALLKRWWAPKSFGVSLFECEQDVRVGGAYRFAFGRDPKNPEVFSGRYVEVDPPSRLVLTQLYERVADVGDVVVTADFEESEGRRVSLFASSSQARKHWRALWPPGWRAECG
jgi:uncharacterized protein YndB with AHSA1/START domain/DNA-binding transcriptional ArsR family regulator